MRELHRPITLLLIEGPARGRRIFFSRMYVDLRVRKIRQTAGVFKVQVGEHDMSHILSPKAKCLDLRKRGHVSPGRVDGHGPSEQRAESAAVADVDARVRHSREIVMATTYELLAEEGLAGVTVDAIARRSGVAKTTIYRHWAANGPPRGHPPIAHGRGGAQS